MQYFKSSIFTCSSLKLAVAALFMLPAFAGAATYYVNPATGSDTASGSSTAPWKTITKAKATVVAGDTVILRSGKYGAVSFGSTDRNGSSWTSPITYKAEAGAAPVFDTLKLSAGSAKRYLVFDGISIITTTGAGRVLTIQDCSCVQFKNMKIQGDFTTRGVAGTTGYCVYFLTSSGRSNSDIWIEDCEIRDATVGIEVTGTVGANVVMRNNELHHFAGSAIKMATAAGNGTIYIEGNHIYDQDRVNGEHGTGISIRNDNLVVRNNVIHNFGNTRGIRTYQLIFPDRGYCNMLFENNLVYDPVNMYAVEFVDMGSNFVIRNNTFVGRPRGRTGTQYYEYALQMLLATNASPSTISVQNNVLVGAVAMPSSIPATNLTNNVIYSLIRGGAWASSVANNRIITSSATNSSYFYPSGKFFIGNANFDAYAHKVLTNSHGINLNDAYQLASASSAIDYCPLTIAPAKDQLDASRVDMPNVGNNGSNYADSGCFEFGGTTNSPGEGVLEFAPIAAQTVAENQLLTIRPVATDSLGAAVTYTAQNLPTGATFINGTFSWTPGYLQSGSYTVTFTASNGTSQRSQPVSITVTNVNRAPILSGIGNRTVEAGTLLAFDVVASDPDSDVLTCTATPMPTGASMMLRTFSWMPSLSQVGTYNVLFTVSDGQLQTSQQITITVTATQTEPVNSAPVLASIGSKSAQTGTTLSFTVSATDTDGDALTYSAGNLPSGATFSNRVFTWTPASSGTYSVAVAVSDGSLTDSETVVITVTAPTSTTNRAPVFTPVSSKTVQERSLLSFYVSATDADGDPITYSIRGLPTYASFSNRQFYWRPTYDQQGSYTVTFVASDGKTSTLMPVTITVTNLNRAPVLYAIGSKTGYRGQTLSFNVKGADADGTPVTFAATGLPSGARFTTGSYGTFSWTPSSSQAGTYYVTFTVSDGSLTDSERVAITIR